MNKVEMNGYTRISKQYARTLWRSKPEVAIAMVPCNQIPGHPMGTTVIASNEARTSDDWTFDQYVQNFALCNCGPARDVGRYPSFYIVKVV